MPSLRTRLYASLAAWVIGGYLLSTILEGGWLILAGIAERVNDFDTLRFDI